MKPTKLPNAELISADPLSGVYTYDGKEIVKVIAGQLELSVYKNEEKIGKIHPGSDRSGSMWIKENCIGEYEFSNGAYTITPYKDGREKDVPIFGIHPLDYLLSKLDLKSCIDFYEDKQKMLDLWTQKASTTEYDSFLLCKEVVDCYERNLKEWERNLDKKCIIVQSNFKVSYEMFHRSIFVLQDLCGVGTLYKKQTRPRTLEDALLGVGVEEKEAKKEKLLCEEYLQKTRDLYSKSRELCDRDTDLTYNLLTRKLHEGKTLTPEEGDALDWAGEILSQDH